MYFSLDYNDTNENCASWTWWASLTQKFLLHPHKTGRTFAADVIEQELTWSQGSLVSGRYICSLHISELFCDPLSLSATSYLLCFHGLKPGSNPWFSHRENKLIIYLFNIIGIVCTCHGVCVWRSEDSLIEGKTSASITWDRWWACCHFLIRKIWGINGIVCTINMISLSSSCIWDSWIYRNVHLFSFLS